MQGSVVVIMGDSLGASSILETLVDWQAVGLLREFVWVESSLVKRGAVPALLAKEGLLRGTTVQEALHGRAGGSVRLAALHPLFGGEPAPSVQSERELQDALTGAGFGYSSALRIIVPRGSHDQPTQDLYRGGWRNIVLSPEESTSPVSGTVPLSENITDTELAAHSVSAIASLLGLWRGIDGAPFDGSHPLQNAVSLARTHVRWLDASRAESLIRHRVLDISGQVPQPLVGGQPGTFLPDPGASARDMATRIVQSHQQSFRSTMEGEVHTGATTIGILDSFRMFLVFLTSSLLFKPQMWMKVLRRRVASTAANATQALFFGNDSHFLVVSGLESTEMTSSQLSHLGRGLEQHLMAHGAISQKRPPTFPDFFKDVMHGAFALVDGGQRGNIMGVKVGADVGVVSSIDFVTPAKTTDFLVSNSLYADCEGGSAIPSYDVRGMRATHAAMNARSSYGDGSAGPAAAAHALHSWAREQPRTYVRHITETLDVLVEDAAGRVKYFVNQLQTSAHPDEASGGAAGRRTASALRWTALIHVVVAVVLYFVWDWQEWETTTLIALGVGVLSSWLISSFMVFVKGQREQFAEIHRQEQLRSNHEVYRTNLIRSVSDLSNSTAAYEQSLRWSSVLRSFLADPFGQSQDDAGVAGPPQLTNMPRNVGLGELALDPRLEAKLGAHLRAVSFTSGWLSQPWDHVFRAAGHTIGADGFALEQQPDRMWDQQVGVQHSLLDRWVPVLADDGVPVTAGDITWQQVAARLASPDFRVDWRREVGVRIHGGLTISQDEFFKGYERPTRAVSDFDLRLQSDEASNDGFEAGGDPWMDDVEVGLGRRVVRVEESRGLRPFELTIFAETRRVETEAPVWQMPSFGESQ